MRLLQCSIYLYAVLYRLFFLIVNEVIPCGLLKM
jgi:hypothetical protein